MISQFYEEEASMAHQDKIITETYDKKNELESYIYDMRNKLQTIYTGYVKPAVAQTFLE